MLVDERFIGGLVNVQAIVRYQPIVERGIRQPADT
jgi:hypothetical protein